jgi:hypothetical protein
MKCEFSKDNNKIFTYSNMNLSLVIGIIAMDGVPIKTIELSFDVVKDTFLHKVIEVDNDENVLLGFQIN